MTPDEYKKLTENSLQIYRIEIRVNQNQLMLSCDRNSLAYLMLNDEGRKGVDEVMDAMITAGTKVATADCTEHETIVDNRTPTDDGFFDRAEVIDAE
jgi:hypothetical protein